MSHSFSRRLRCKSSRPRSWCPAVIVPRSSRRASCSPPATPEAGERLIHMGARTDFGPPPLFGTPEAPPRLGFGAWAVGGAESGGWSDAGDERERLATIHRALERGITVFDTAPSYGDGASETLSGRALAPHRDRVVIATKVGPRDDPRASLERSLRRLATDAVDLIQLHETLARWEWRLEQLHTLQEEGKARAIGLCNATHLQLARACGIAPLVTYQGSYNLFRSEERRVGKECR